MTRLKTALKIIRPKTRREIIFAIIAWIIAGWLVHFYDAPRTVVFTNPKAPVNESLAKAKKYGCPSGQVLARLQEGDTHPDTRPRCVRIEDTCLLHPQNQSMLAMYGVIINVTQHLRSFTKKGRPKPPA